MLKHNLRRLASLSGGISRGRAKRRGADAPYLLFGNALTITASDFGDAVFPQAVGGVGDGRSKSKKTLFHDPGLAGPGPAGRHVAGEEARVARGADGGVPGSGGAVYVAFVAGPRARRAVGGPSGDWLRRGVAAGPILAGRRDGVDRLAWRRAHDDPRQVGAFRESARGSPATCRAS